MLGFMEAPVFFKENDTPSNRTHIQLPKPTLAAATAEAKRVKKQLTEREKEFALKITSYRQQRAVMMKHIFSRVRFWRLWRQFAIVLYAT